MRKVRVAVIGCGALANATHLPTIYNDESYELSIVCDTNIQNAEIAFAKWGAKKIEVDWRNVVNSSKVDLIVLCTHTNLRAELICESLRKGIPVYTEKPLAESIEEMEEIRKTFLKTGTPVCVGHNRRSSPAMLEFKRLVDKAYVNGCSRPAMVDRTSEKNINKLKEEEQMQVLIRVNDDIRSWKGWIFQDESGIILAEMVHFIDIALWINKSNPVEVYAMGSNKGNFTELIKFEDGSITTLQHTLVGNFDYPKELFEVSVNNVFLALNHHLTIEQRGIEDEPFRKTYSLKRIGVEHYGYGIEAFNDLSDDLYHKNIKGEKDELEMAMPNKGHSDHLERFVKHIKGTGENPCSLDSAILVTKIALCLLESVKTGRSIKVFGENFDN